MNLILILFVLTVFSIGQCRGFKLCSEISEDPELCKMNPIYKNNKPPKPWPLPVYVTIEIYDVIEINAADQTLTIFAMILVSWEDPELSFSSRNYSE